MSRSTTLAQSPFRVPRRNCKIFGKVNVKELTIFLPFEQTHGEAGFVPPFVCQKSLTSFHTTNKKLF